MLLKPLQSLTNLLLKKPVDLYFWAHHKTLRDNYRRYFCDLSRYGDRLVVTVWPLTDSGFKKIQFNIDETWGGPRFECDLQRMAEVFADAR